MELVGPAEPSRAPRFIIMVAAGEVGAEEEMCCEVWTLRTEELLFLGPIEVAGLARGLRAAVTGFVDEEVMVRAEGAELLAAVGRRVEGRLSGSVKPGSLRS